MAGRTAWILLPDRGSDPEPDPDPDPDSDPDPDPRAHQLSPLPCPPRRQTLLPSTI